MDNMTTTNNNVQTVEEQLDQLELGLLDAEPYNAEYHANADNEYIDSLTDSISRLGLMMPIYYKVVNEQIKIVKGNTRYRIIRKLISDNTWNYEIKLRPINTDSSADFYASATYMHRHTTSLQRAMYGARFLWDDIAAKPASDRDTIPNEVAKAVNSNAEYCRLAHNLLKCNTWFFDLVYVYKKLNKPDIEAFMGIFASDEAAHSHIAQKIIEKMKEICQNCKNKKKEIPDTIYRNAKRDVTGNSHTVNEINAANKKLAKSIGVNQVSGDILTNITALTNEWESKTQAMQKGCIHTDFKIPDEKIDLLKKLIGMVISVDVTILYDDDEEREAA